VEGHVHGILHVDEVTHLATVGVFGPVALEEADLASGADLLIRFANQAAHVTLVVFVWTKHVEILDANDVGEELLPPGK
jgi:predicted nucleotidyltransferase